MDKFKRDILRISGERIRRARMLKGYRQKELAAICGYADSTTIYKIEKGIQDIPTSKIKQLCKALDIDFNYLKGDIDYIMDLDGAAVVFERKTVDDRRGIIMNKITDLLNKATETQLEQTYKILKAIIGSEDNGDADL